MEAKGAKMTETPGWHLRLEAVDVPA